MNYDANFRSLGSGGVGGSGPLRADALETDFFYATGHIRNREPRENEKRGPVNGAGSAPGAWATDDQFGTTG